MGRLHNKVAIITGGNSGIGEGIAVRFAEEGAKVAIFGRNADTLNAVKHKIGDDVLAVQGDVTSKEDLDRLFQETMDHFGKIDILVASAGVTRRMHVKDYTYEDFDYVVNINYRGLFFCVNQSLPYLNQNAAIVLISSVAGHINVKHHSLYSSSKAAVSKLAKSFAYDLAPEGIRVNAISPGWIKTPIFESRLSEDPDYLNRRERGIPLQRIGEPRDIANAAVFLASEEACYITGADLLVDGGISSTFTMPSEQ